MKWNILFLSIACLSVSFYSWSAHYSHPPIDAYSIMIGDNSASYYSDYEKNTYKNPQKITPPLEHLMREYRALFFIQKNGLLWKFALKKGGDLYDLLIDREILIKNKEQLPINAEPVHHTLNLPDDVLDRSSEDGVDAFKVSLEDAVNDPRDCDWISID